MLQFFCMNTLVKRWFYPVVMSCAVLSTCLVQAQTIPPWQNQDKGHYAFTQWPGGQLDIQFSVPTNSNADTPILLVIPGARRNAEQYRDHWHELAKQHDFIVLTLGCSLKVCSSEYQYNLGGIQDATGKSVVLAQQLFSAPELIFNDFIKRFGSNQNQFALYGHSAGGGFVHLYMLMHPDAPVSQAVAANPAFFTMPDLQDSFPFGLQGTAVNEAAIDQWLGKPLTIMLADQDMGPRSKPLSDSERARQQGLNVFSRGLSFYANAMNWAAKRHINTPWKIEVVQNVGHDSSKITPHALKYLFPNMQGE